MRESEAQFQKWVMDTAKGFGWKVWHAPTPMKPIGRNQFVPDARGRGLPDLFMLHDDPPRFILAELKGEDGVVSVEQGEFLRLARGVADALRAEREDVVYDGPPPLRVFVWRPVHRELIEATLRGA